MSAFIFWRLFIKCRLIFHVRLKLNTELDTSKKSNHALQKVPTQHIVFPFSYQNADWMDKSRRQGAQYDDFTGENVSRAFTNSVNVIATELFFSNSSVYIENDTCVETGKQVIFPSLNFLMSNYV